jgi:Fe-S-cluster containining protein
MSMRSVALFAHIVGMLGLFVGLSLEWLSLEFLRRPTTPDQRSQWVSVLAALPRYIATGIGLTPLGLGRSPAQHVPDARFGHDEKYLCPHFIQQDGGLCSIWQHREAVCTTFFCKFVRGAVGASFWSALRRLLEAIEQALAWQCVETLDVGAAAVSLLLGAAGDARHDTVTLRQDGTYAADDLRAIWGRWAGRERAFYEAADYMRSAGNPDGRRVIIMITGITTFFGCAGPSLEEARMAVLESGSVVCGIIPKTAGQRMENGIMIAAAGIGGLFKAKSSNLKQLADETGGEVLTDKPENLDRVFNNLIDHLRTRYTIGFVSTNRKRDGSFRKLKLDLARPVQKSDERLVIKTKRGYIAARDARQTDERSRVK